jgi:hypothetical protein
MQENRGLAVRLAAQLPIDLVSVAYVEKPMIVGFDRRVELVLALRHVRLSHGEPSAGVQL